MDIKLAVIEPILNEGDYYCCPQCKESLMQVKEGETIYADEVFSFDKIDTIYTAASLARCPVCDFWFSIEMIHPMYWRGNGSQNG
jgi:uncharacterized protein YbaR (Trm112 family)